MPTLGVLKKDGNKHKWETAEKSSPSSTDAC